MRLSQPETFETREVRGKKILLFRKVVQKVFRKVVGLEQKLI